MGTTTTEPQAAPTLRFLLGEWDRESDEMQKLYLAIQPRIVELLRQAGGCASSAPDENGLCRTYALGLKEGGLRISVLKAGEQLPNGGIVPYCVTQYERIRKLDDRLRAAATRAMEARRRVGERARELAGEDIAPEALAAAVLVLQKEEDPAPEPRKPDPLDIPRTEFLVELSYYVEHAEEIPGCTSDVHEVASFAAALFRLAGQGSGIPFIFEIRDDRVLTFVEHMAAGMYHFRCERK